MSDLYERLLARLAELDAWTVDDRTAPDGANLHRDLGQMRGALRAVVERHNPVPCGWPTCRTSDTHRVCAACGRAVSYPCPDVQVIARELGVDGG